MARWRLTSPHYLRVPVLPDGTAIEWEHKETSRDSGRTVRKLFPVPMLLDPRDPADHNYPGEIIVAHEAGEHQRNDYLFLGDPTQEMEPLDAEAEAITAARRPIWEHPIETLPINGGMSPGESAFMEQMMKAFAGAAKAPETQSVPKAEFDAMKAELEQLKAAVAANQPAPAATVRRA